MSARPHEHRINFRIYYEDTDAGGIVYYANYLRFAERGRSEYLRDLQLENRRLMQDKGFLFVVRHIEADYLYPARLDDEITVETCVSAVKNASFIMKQSIFCHDRLLFTMDVVLACVDLDGKLAKLPEFLQEILRQHIVTAEA